MSAPDYANQSIPLSLRAQDAENAWRAGDPNAYAWMEHLKLEQAQAAGAHHSGINPATTAGLKPDSAEAPPKTEAQKAIEAGDVHGFIDQIRNPDFGSVVPGQQTVDLTRSGAAFDRFDAQMTENRAAAFGPTAQARAQAARDAQAQVDGQPRLHAQAPANETSFERSMREMQEAGQNAQEFVRSMGGSDTTPAVAKAEAEGRWGDAFKMKFENTFGA